MNHKMGSGNSEGQNWGGVCETKFKLFFSFLRIIFSVLGIGKYNWKTKTVGYDLHKLIKSYEKINHQVGEAADTPQT